MVCFLGMFYVWQLRIKLLKFTMTVNGDSILPYLLRWVMIYSFGINTDLGNRSQFDPLPWLHRRIKQIWKVCEHTEVWEDISTHMNYLLVWHFRKKSTKISSNYCEIWRNILGVYFLCRVYFGTLGDNAGWIKGRHWCTPP